MSDPETDTISLYDTPYNELCTYHKTPTLEDLENPSAIPCQTEIVPITFTATGIRLITAYTVLQTPSHQSDILLFSTDTPQPILRTFHSSTHFDTHTYAIIYNGMQHILDTHVHDRKLNQTVLISIQTMVKKTSIELQTPMIALQGLSVPRKKRTIFYPYENYLQHLQRYMQLSTMHECLILIC